METAQKHNNLSKYCSLSLVELAEKIAYDSDFQALSELHNNRRAFRSHRRQSSFRSHRNRQDSRDEDKRLLLAEYIEVLSESEKGYSQLILDKAYDLTLGKFLNIPRKNTDALKSDGPDCRYYYMAYVKAARKRIESDMDVIETDNLACNLLQRHVVRHFQLSILDCKRTDQKLVRRYSWHIKGSVIQLQLPVELPGSICNKWLCEKFPEVDPDRPGERERIQNAIDASISKKYVLSLSGNNTFDFEIPDDTDSPFDTLEQQLENSGLSTTVACEKADNIGLQRPAIRRLGPVHLKNMIFRIFEDIKGQCYDASVVADMFGVSRPSLCRFAGTRWRSSDSSHIPDLWKNTAQVLCSNSRFNSLLQDKELVERILSIATGGVLSDE